MTGSCKPQNHYISLGDTHRIEVTVDGGQRYVPQVWVADPSFSSLEGSENAHAGTDWEDGTWQPLLPEGESRQVLLDARNDCARHAEKEVIE